MGISERTLAALREQRDKFERMATELYAVNPSSIVGERYEGISLGIAMAMRTIENCEIAEVVQAVAEVEQRRAAHVEI